VRNVVLALVVVLFLTSARGILPAQSNAGSAESRNKAIIEASFRAWSSGTGSPFDLLADNATWTIVGRSVAAKTYESREAFMRDVIRPFNARMRTPLTPVIRHIYTDGDTVSVFFDAAAVRIAGPWPTPLRTPQPPALQLGATPRASSESPPRRHRARSEGTSDASVMKPAALVLNLSVAVSLVSTRPGKGRARGMVLSGFGREILRLGSGCERVSGRPHERGICQLLSLKLSLRPPKSGHPEPRGAMSVNRGSN
jgi:ketosteroid isomerase-like protein